MKHMKKLLSLLLAAALGVGLAVPAAAALAVNETPVITVQPRDKGVLPGEEFTLSVQAHIPNGDAAGYQWYDATWHAAPYGSTMIGETGPELAITASTRYSMNNKYYCVVYNATLGRSAGSVTSETVSVTQRPLTAAEMPVITLQPRDVTAASGVDHILSIQAYTPNGAPVGYQWYRSDGLLLTNRTGAEYFRPQSDSYYCVAYNADLGLLAGGAKSNTVTVTVPKAATLPTARQLLEEYKGYLNNGLSLGENLKKDPLYLINGVIEKTSVITMICVMWVLDLFNVPADRVQSLGGNAIQGIAMVFLIPALAIYVLVFALPVSLVMLPFGGML